MSDVPATTPSADTAIIILQTDPGNNNPNFQLDSQNSSNIIFTLPIGISPGVKNDSEMTVTGDPVLGASPSTELQIAEIGEEPVTEKGDTGEFSQSVLYMPEQDHDWEPDNPAGSEIASPMRTQPAVKPFICPFCDKGFNGQDALTQHIKLHTGERPYFCPHCDMRFNRKAHLERHIRAHSGEKPFACDKCNKRFSEKYYLILHTRTHTGQKPYPCQQCEMKFTRKSHLTRHLKTHRLS